MIWVRKESSFLGVTKCIPQWDDGRGNTGVELPKLCQATLETGRGWHGDAHSLLDLFPPFLQGGAKPASAGPEPYPQVCWSVCLSSKTIQKLARFQIRKPASHSGTYKWYLVRIQSWLYQADTESKNWVAKRHLADLSCVLSVCLLVF